MLDSHVAVVPKHLDVPPGADSEGLRERRRAIGTRIFANYSAVFVSLMILAFYDALPGNQTCVLLELHQLCLVAVTS